MSNADPRDVCGCGLLDIDCWSDMGPAEEITPEEWDRHDAAVGEWSEYLEAHRAEWDNDEEETE